MGYTYKDGTLYNIKGRKLGSDNGLGYLKIHTKGLNYKKKYIGTFTTKEEAHEAYLLTKRRVHSTCTI